MEHKTFSLNIQKCCKCPETNCSLGHQKTSIKVFLIKKSVNHTRIKNETICLGDCLEESMIVAHVCLQIFHSGLPQFASLGYSRRCVLGAPTPFTILYVADYIILYTFYQPWSHYCSVTLPPSSSNTSVLQLQYPPHQPSHRSICCDIAHTPAGIALVTRSW